MGMPPADDGKWYPYRKSTGMKDAKLLKILVEERAMVRYSRP